MSSSASHTSDGRKKLTITALGARSKPYVKSLRINGVLVEAPVIKHEQIANGADVVFEMSDQIEAWGNEAGVAGALLASQGRWERLSHSIQELMELNRDEL